MKIIVIGLGMLKSSGKQVFSEEFLTIIGVHLERSNSHLWNYPMIFFFIFIYEKNLLVIKFFLFFVGSLDLRKGLNKAKQKALETKIYPLTRHGLMMTNRSDVESIFRGFSSPKLDLKQNNL